MATTKAPHRRQDAPADSAETGLLRPGHLGLQLVSESRAPPLRPSDAQLRGRLAGARVLLVDDHAPLRKIVALMLGEMGFRGVDQAGDGRLALELFLSKRYDLVVSDWDMPRLDGLGLLRAIREVSEQPETPVLMLSGLVTDERARLAMEAGADGLMQKPFLGESFKNKVLSLVASQPASLPPPSGSGVFRWRR